MADYIYTRLGALDFEPEWYVRVTDIAGFREAEHGVEVLLTSGAKVDGSITVPELMARMMSSLTASDDGA
jgi:hypothetical protein